MTLAEDPTQYEGTLQQLSHTAPCGEARSAMITKDELEKLWRSARTSEQLDRYYELRRERDAATQLVLMVCARCHCGFQRLP